MTIRLIPKIDLKLVKLAFRSIISIFFIGFVFYANAQTKSVYIVTVDNLNVRSGPGTNYEVISKLEKGAEVIVVSTENSNWYEIDLGISETSYTSSKFLELDNEWIDHNHTSGSNPNCENINPKYDKKLDNFLRIKVGSNTDVVVKLMEINNYGKDVCTRIVFIRSADTYEIKNIPEGKYYLKIAYGKDWRQKNIDGKCHGKFMVGPIYEKGDKILDFNKIEKDEYYDIPSFELSLDVIYTYDYLNKFNAGEIDEDEFNE